MTDLLRVVGFQFWDFGLGWVLGVLLGIVGTLLAVPRVQARRQKRRARDDEQRAADLRAIEGADIEAQRLNLVAFVERHRDNGNVRQRLYGEQHTFIREKRQIDESEPDDESG